MMAIPGNITGEVAEILLERRTSAHARKILMLIACVDCGYPELPTVTQAVGGHPSAQSAQ